jgi:hypothetical protein
MSARRGKQRDAEERRRELRLEALLALLEEAMMWVHTKYINDYLVALAQEVPKQRRPLSKSGERWLAESAVLATRANPLPGRLKALFAEDEGTPGAHL